MSDQPAARLVEALSSVLSQVAKPSQLLKTILGQSVAQTGADRGVFVQVTQSGKLSYRVLYKSSLTDPNWTVRSTLAGDGTEKAITDPLSLPRHFYLVETIP